MKSLTRIMLIAVLTGLVTISALAAAAPYPQSEVITGVDWAPVSEIMRDAGGNDTWPITWADDGDLYTAYGDGDGFATPDTGRLSLGLAKVSGGPENLVGVNIISSTGQQTGDGSSGKKASGMLMVDGVLYMWMRNANNDGEECQLAWSTDHAVSWVSSPWNFAEFGYCAFLNYGQNYAGAGNYVYMVTPDGPSAYDAVDDFVLTRVPTDQITDRNAYEFFVSADAGNTPTWSSDIADRGPVFSHAGHARRSGISYNAALQRYLWWQQYHPNGGGDTRFDHGFGVYDAPEPWGPWTTAYFTEDWDVGPGETASFPPKWMSVDGKTMYLVFSGDDAFSVRKVTLTVAGEPTAPTPPTGLQVH